MVYIKETNTTLNVTLNRLSFELKAIRNDKTYPARIQYVPVSIYGSTVRPTDTVDIQHFPSRVAEIIKQNGLSCILAHRHDMYHCMVRLNFTVVLEQVA